MSKPDQPLHRFDGAFHWTALPVEAQVAIGAVALEIAVAWRIQAQVMAEFNPVAITGRESMAVKERSLAAFAAGETNACLISLRAATGLDGLQQRARVIVFAELDWSPAVHRQGEDRAHRYGQRESVLAYYLVTDVGTDPGMIATIGVKESQFTGMMHDRPVSEDDVRQSERVAEQHKASVLRMLRESF